MSLIICLYFPKVLAMDSTRVLKNYFYASKDTLSSNEEKLISIENLKVNLFGFKNLEDSTQSLDIPFQLAGHLMLVEAEINQTKGFFILDSGAPDLKLNTQYFNTGGSAKTTSSGGITGNIQVSFQYIDSFSWNDYQLKNAKVESFDMSHIEKSKNVKIFGLLGYQVFKNLEIFFDFGNFKITLFNLDKAGNRLKSASQEPKQKISLNKKGHLLVLEAKVGKYNLTLGLDTGAEANVLSKNLNSKVFEKFTILRRAMLNGNGQDKVEVIAGRLQELMLGEIRYLNMRTLITNMESMNEAYNTQLDGMLGYEFLAQQRTSINFKKNELYIW